MEGRTDEDLLIKIRQKLQGDNVSTDWLSCSIFKVPNHLRQKREQAYEPQVISIGPYHHFNDQLKKMEVCKMFYLKKLLERTDTSLEEYVTALKGMEEEARKFYSEPLDHIGGEEFVQMMLLDGCFIIELIRKIAMDKPRDANEHLLTNFILSRAMLDLLLVENQIPFFILLELFNMTVMSNDEFKDFMDIAIKFLSIMMPGSQIGRPLALNQDIKHLLGLLHDGCQAPSSDCQVVCIPCLPEEVRSLSPKAKLNRCSSEVVRSSPPGPSEEQRFVPSKATAIPSSSRSKLSEERVAMAAPLLDFSAPNSSKEEKFLPSDSSHLCYPEEMDALAAEPPISFSPPKASEGEEIEPVRGAAPLIRLPSKTLKEASLSPPNVERDSKRASGPNKNEWQRIRSATELTEAGINFKKTTGRLFDIRFEEGVMSGVMLIPTLNINDNTESILRNLVAYEQWFKGASSQCFTDYVTFMDCLINTEKDVELLCLPGVIDSWLGDHEVVAKIFNKLCDSVLISGKDFSYAKTFNEVNDHCKKPWNRWKANLWHNYFNTPWAGISVFAAVFLLLLTVLQSVYSVLSYQSK